MPHTGCRVDLRKSEWLAEQQLLAGCKAPASFNGYEKTLRQIVNSTKADIQSIFSKHSVLVDIIKALLS